MKPDQYDHFARSYDTENTSSLLNAYYERPAMLELAGEVRGLRVLDAGCGSGPLTAEVAGIDGSPAMIELARRRLGDGVPLHVGDLAAPLPFADDAFDLVTASLVLHYLEDWSAPLAELRRVLAPGGRLLVSVNHPFVRTLNAPEEDYFATRQYSEDLEFDGVPAVLTMWHRPLSAMTRSFVEAGFHVLAVDEPAPSADTPPELMPPRIASGERTAFLCFLFFTLEAA